MTTTRRRTTRERAGSVGARDAIQAAQVSAFGRSGAMCSGGMCHGAARLAAQSHAREMQIITCCLIAS
jgi:hypothetical protein